MKKMSKVLGYLRTSTDKQEINNQRLEILEYARKEGLLVSDFIEVQISSRKSVKDRRIDELLGKLNFGDTVIATELSRIGRSTVEVITIINELIKNGIDIVIVKQGLKINAGNKDDMTSKVMVTMLSLFAELERDLISHRTKEALRSKKAQGQVLGKPKGTIQKSVYDKHRDRIIELLSLGLSVQKIAQKHLGLKYSSSLSGYVNKRKLREEAGKLALKK
jgi:DNA invertase Pin-like site-specific DNA recombinase